MSRRAAGRALTMLGTVMSLAGALGLLLDRPTPVPGAAVAVTTPPGTAAEASPDGEATPAPGEPEAAAFTTAEDPDDDLYSCADPGGTLPEQAEWLDIVAVEARQAEHPETGETGDSLLLRVRRPSPDPAVSFTAVVLVEPDGPPSEQGALGLAGLQWLLVYDGGQFQRAAYLVGQDGVQPADDEPFRVRYEGLGDRVEIEFYGPAGTRYHAALLSDGERCDTVLPAA